MDQKGLVRFLLLRENLGNHLFLNPQRQLRDTSQGVSSQGD